MKETNTWPDPSTYMMLTAPAAATTAKRIEEDNKTDLYISPPIETPFTINQLYAILHATGPLITEFPVPVQVLIDISCPCTVISTELCNHLGLHQYPLPTREN